MTLKRFKTAQFWIKLSSYVWVVTLILFILYALLFNQNESEALKYSGLAFVNVVIGILAFCMIFVLPILSFFRENYKSFLNSKAAITALLIIIFCLVGYNLNIAFEPKRTDNIKYNSVNGTVIPALPDETSLPIPTLVKQQVNETRTTNNLIDCIGPDNNTFKTTLEECTKLNMAWGKSPDYITPCNVSTNCGGGTIKIKKSECEKLTCCELAKNSWYLYPNNTTCDQAQSNYNASKYPPCTIYYSALGYSKTYFYTSPSDCTYYQQKANLASQPLNLPKFNIAPPPTIEPYQYSQEYLDAIARYNQEISKPYQPSQFVAPTPKCYATWDEYFNAHPNYAPQNIKGTSVNPPCD